MLEHLKIMEWELIDMFSTPTFVRKIISAKYKGYVHVKLIKELNSGDICHAEAILDTYEVKRLLKINT